MPRKKKPSINSASRRPEAMFRQFLIVELMGLCIWASWIAFRPWDASSPRSMTAFGLMAAGLLLLQILALAWQLRQIRLAQANEDTETARSTGHRSLPVLVMGFLLIAGPPLALTLTSPDAISRAWYALMHTNSFSLATEYGESLLRRHSRIEAKGRIDWGLAGSLERMVKENARTSFPHNMLKIALSSEPEEPPPGHPVRGLLAEEIEASGIVLHRNAIPALIDRKCAGSCAFLFLGAPERLATADGRLVLYALPDWLMSRNDQEAFLHQAGLSGLTIRRIMEATPEAPWQPDRMTLWEEHAVTAFLPDGEALFAFLASRDGTNVFDVRETFINVQKDNYPYERIWGPITALLLPDAIRLLPYAPQEQVQEFSRLMAGQIENLRRNDSTLCATFVPGTFPAADFALAIDELLLRRQRDMMADILFTVRTPTARASKTQTSLIARGEEIIARIRADNAFDDDTAFDRACTQTARIYEESLRLSPEETSAVIMALSQTALHQDALQRRMNALKSALPSPTTP